MNKMKLSNLLTGNGSRQGRWFVAFIIAVGIAIWLSVTTEEFLSSENLLNLVAQAMPLIIASIGMMLVVLVGGLDLSVGSVISFTTAILALAQFIILGIARILRPVSGGDIPDIVITAVSGSVLGIPFPVFWGIFAILLGWKLVHGSRFGLHLFAIGGGTASGVTDAAHNFGVDDKNKVLLAYVGSSCFAALAGVFLAGRIVSGDPNVGLLFEIDAVTAVAIGGTQLAGGVGSLHGTVLGAVVMALLANGMNLANISPFIQTTIKGVILLLVVGIQSRKKMGL